MSTVVIPGKDRPAVPVAEYVRMSTDLQIYSPVNQSVAIAAYAETHGMEVVRSYIDEGRSGLDLGGRDGLQRLLRDVRTGNADYEAVLVYDVSRWGRFQNADEAAYYEFICTRAGIRVCYVAEPFDNDGSPLAAILKGLKRTMAAEYSRELSAKVTAGQRRLANLGYHQGALAGYGLRRMRVDKNGKPKGILAIGDRKSLVTDRVILVPGPATEVAIILRIFNAYVSGKSAHQIANMLNAEGISTHIGGQWRYSIVANILTNEKYVGNAVYGRQSKRLKQSVTDKPAAEWARVNGAYKGVVSEKLFLEARRRPPRRVSRKTDEELLEPLRVILAREGTITEGLINAEPGVFCARLYSERFGGLRGVYARLGLELRTNLAYADIRRRIAPWRETLTAFTCEMLADGGSVIERTGWSITVDRTWSLSFYVMQSSEYGDGHQWFIRRKPEPTDIVVFAQMPSDGSIPMAYIVLPRNRFLAWPKVIYDSNTPSIDSFTFPSLAVLSDLGRLSRIGGSPCT
jgi:DNA invertase Pin-like site-specific DNA recombinase